jgi:hypothetical protein
MDMEWKLGRSARMTEFGIVCIRLNLTPMLLLESCWSKPSFWISLLHVTFFGFVRSMHSETDLGAFIRLVHSRWWFQCVFWPAFISLRQVVWMVKLNIKIR